MTVNLIAYDVWMRHLWTEELSNRGRKATAKVVVPLFRHPKPVKEVM